MLEILSTDFTHLLYVGGRRKAGSWHGSISWTSGRRAGPWRHGVMAGCPPAVGTENIRPFSSMAGIRVISSSIRKPSIHLMPSRASDLRE